MTTSELTHQQRQSQAAFDAFVDAEIAPHADQYDREERTPPELIGKLARQGFLGALIPRAYGGIEMDMITFGLLNGAVGAGCSSIRSLITVHSMVCHALLRWGSKQQRADWLPSLAAGKAIAALCLTEPNAGSDVKSIETTAEPHDHYYVLNGHKKWITYGQIADLFLIFARCEGKHVAFLVERDTPGLSTRPMRDLLGTRASMLAEVYMEECQVPRSVQIGRLGFGLTAVAMSALDVGRYSVAWGCVGIAQACLVASVRYSGERKQFDAYLKDHQLIQLMIANMVTNVKAARLLCLNAGHLKQEGHPDSVMETWIAKYFASITATQAAGYAVQIHGANGCSGNYPVQRYLRDATIMEIIEGSTQMHQLMIADHASKEFMNDSVMRTS